MRIWKYELPTDKSEFEIEMPHALFRSLQIQNGVPVTWWAVWTNLDDKPVTRRFEWVATGEEEPNVPYRGTIQLNDGALVLHMFDHGVSE